MRPKKRAKYYIKKARNKLEDIALAIINRLKISGMLFKEFKLLVRRRKTPILALSLPLILLVVYTVATTSLSSPQTTIRACVCSDDPRADEVIDSLVGDFEVTRLRSEFCVFDLMNMVKSSECIIGFVIPNTFTSSLDDARQASITYYVDDSNPTTASMVSFLLERGFTPYSMSVVESTEEELGLIAGTARENLAGAIQALNITQEILKDNEALFGLTYPLISSYLLNSISELEDYDAELQFVEDLNVNFLTNPVTFNKGEVYSGVNAKSFNFASIFGIVSLFTLLLLASTSIIFDKETNYLLRIKATKTPLPTYLFSKVVFYMTISLGQFFLVMLLTFIQGALFNFNFLALMTAFAAITTLNTSLGLLIGSVSENENVAILFSLTLSLPFLFLSGSFFPLELMPDYIQFIGRIAPLHPEVMLLKQASVLGWTLDMISPLLNELLLISILLLLTTYLILKYKR